MGRKQQQKNHSFYRNGVTKQNAYSMIELLIATALGVFILAGVIESYIAFKRIYQLQNALTQIQENARFAMYYLNKQIKSVEADSCSSIHGYEFPALPPYLNKMVKADTSVLEVRQCGVSESKITDYFVGDTGRKDSNGNKVYALYEKIKDHNKLELVDHVNTINIHYGIENSAGDAITEMLSGDKVQDWALVKSVDLSLSFSSATGLTKQWQIYSALNSSKGQR